MASLRPPEKWSLFGRRWSHGIVSYRLMWARLRPLSFFYVKIPYGDLKCLKWALITP